MKRTISALAGIIVAYALAGLAQQPLEPIKGTYERITVHGKALEGNLSGDSADREVSVYLPPGYAANTSRRYPVVYMLHGFTDSDERWFGLVKHFVSVPVNYERALAAGAREMILVMPNAFTRFQGSMYSSGPTTGDWELFVARDLVAFVDGRYRTIASRDARGLTGHSMGGYGALRIGMKFPEVFGSVYAMSPCCLASRGAAPDNPAFARAEAIRTVEEIGKADFGTKAMLASAAAWSPNPKNPPFFFDLPVKGGAVMPEVVAKWAANSPLALVDQYIGRLRTLRGLAVDVGDQDGSITATSKTLHDVLTNYGVRHQFEVYTGNHVNGVARQLETKVFRFFSSALAAQETGTVARRLSPRDVDALPSKPADRRIPYGKDDLQFGDLRLPKGAGPFPVAVVIHGGCWMAKLATLQNTAAFADALRDAGFATWNVEYRPADRPGGGWPGTFADVAAATDWLRDIAKEHRLDLKRVVAVGHSAGGHLALWAAARSRLPKSSPLHSVSPLTLRAAVALGGPGDLRAIRAYDEKICGADVVDRLIGGTPEAHPERYAQASPIEMLPFGVRQVLIVGLDDSVMPPAEREAYVAKATKAGDRAEIVEVQGGHFEVIAPTSAAWPAVRDKLLEIVKLP